MKLINMLKELNFYKKLQFLLYLILLTHLLYFFMFLFIWQPILYILNVFSIAVYFWCLDLIKKDKNSIDKIFRIIRIEVTAHAAICCYFLGWNYGFQNIIIAFVSIVFFASFANDKENIVFNVIQMIVCVFLFSHDRANPTDFTLTANIFHIINFFVIVVFICLMMLDFMKTLDTQLQFDYNLSKKKFGEQANKDMLTDTLNRNYFYNFALKDILGLNQHTSIAIGDIDFFKYINDTYGHASGDKVLAAISGILKENIGNKDLVFRWGGEEFLIVMPNTTLKYSVEILERIRRRISELKFSFENQNINVTMTFGLVNAKLHESLELDAVLKKADELLYQGKTSGKNMILSALVITPTSQF